MEINQHTYLWRENWKPRKLMIPESRDYPQALKLRKVCPGAFLNCWRLVTSLFLLFSSLLNHYVYNYYPVSVPALYFGSRQFLFFGFTGLQIEKNYFRMNFTQTSTTLKLDDLDGDIWDFLNWWYLDGILDLGWLFYSGLRFSGTLGWHKCILLLV